MTSLPAAEFVAVPSVGRRFVGSRHVRLGDVDPLGELRLDATARYLQDVASDDTADSGLGGAFAWVVRRTMIEVRRPAVLGEQLELTTWGAGYGRAWAERRTSVRGTAGAAIEAVCLWIRVDPESGRPTALDPAFLTLYGEANQGRTVSSRLSLPRPSGTEQRTPWMVRAADLDVFGHVNNAVHWSVLEEVLAEQRGAPGSSRCGRGEVEYPSSLDPRVTVELLVDRQAEGTAAWIVADEVAVAAARWTPANS